MLHAGCLKRDRSSIFALHALQFYQSQGYKPLLCGTDTTSSSVSQHVLHTDCTSFHIISGPNMAGKSTYLRQVAMIAVMAHAGCFVPAKFAAMPVMDRLLTRLGSSDCIERNSSSFLMEMQARPVL